jgi:NADH-quinone oxidoreductase subunit A
MASPTAIVAYLALFTAVGAVFLFANLVIGRLVRPAAPNEEKLEVYECGEPTIGSSFVQFDLRFYVVALLFIIFDVEVAFFFPWATVFGKATQLAGEGAPVMAADLDPAAPAGVLSTAATARLYELGITETADAAGATIGGAELRNAARKLALTSFADIAVFFGVLMIGFAYVWKRGDLDWVRAVTRPETQPAHRGPPPRTFEPSASILSA